MVVARPPAYGAITRPPIPHDPPTDYDIAQAYQYISHARHFVQNGLGPSSIIGEGLRYQARLIAAHDPQAEAPAWWHQAQAEILERFDALEAGMNQRHNQAEVRLNHIDDRLNNLDAGLHNLNYSLREIANEQSKNHNRECSDGQAINYRIVYIKNTDENGQARYQHPTEVGLPELRTAAQVQALNADETTRYFLGYFPNQQPPGRTQDRKIAIRRAIGLKGSV